MVVISRTMNMKFISSIFILSILLLSCISTQKNNDVCGDVRTPANAEQCAILFTQQKLNVQPTKSEILKYIDALVVEQLKIQSKEYDNKNQLDQAVDAFSKALNKIMLIDKNYLKIFQQKFTEKSKDYRKVKKFKDKDRRELEKEKQKIIEHSMDPINVGRKVIFHQIKAGNFMMGEINEKSDTPIDKPFSMMSTQFTQMMWAALKIAMGEKDIEKINPSKFKTGDESLTIKFENFDVEMKPDHPVEQVSWVDVTEFIRKLNDLSKLDDPKTLNLLKKLIPDHQKNDEYDLPTSEQWEFVMRDRGKADDVFFDKADDADLSKYAWYDKNSENKTHAVAMLLPRLIDGKPFYDMEGNVWEWNKNIYESRGNGGERRITRGGAFGFGVGHLRSSYIGGSKPDLAVDHTGFRLVRTNR